MATFTTVVTLPAAPVGGVLVPGRTTVLNTTIDPTTLASLIAAARVGVATINDTTASTSSVYSSSKQLKKFAPAGQTSPDAYGALVDGVADDSAAIMSMPAASKMHFGGTALLDYPVVINTERQLEGLGRFGGVLKFNPASPAFAASVALPTITALTSDGANLTITFAAPHGRAVDDSIELFAAIPDNWNDIFQVVNVVSSTVLKVPCLYTPAVPTQMPFARTVNALIKFGTQAGLVFGSLLSNLTIDCQSIPDSIGVFCDWGALNENAGLDGVLITHATYRGVRLKSAQFRYDNLEIIMAPPPNPVTSVASGSNGVDLAGAAFHAGTGVVNIPAGDIAAQGIPWAGSAIVAVTGGAGFRTIFYRGTSAGTGPSGQDQLLNVQAAVDVARVMTTGISVTIANVIGEDLTVGATGSGNTQEFGRSTVVTSHASLMRAATRINGPGNIAIDAHHTEYAHAGLIIGDRQAVKAVTVKNFSCASSHMISAAILNPADGGTNSGIILLGTSGDGAAATTICDIPNNTVLRTATNPGVAQYPIPLTGTQPLTAWQSTFLGEVQNVTMTATGGTWNATLPAHGTVAAQTLSGIAFNVAAATLQTALISAWGIANLTVTLSAGVYTITIPRANGCMPQITVNTASLTGGTATVASPNASQNIRLSGTAITEQCRQTVTVPVGLKLNVKVDASMSVAALTGTVVWQIRTSLPGGSLGATPPNGQVRTIVEPAGVAEPIRQRSATFLVDFTGTAYSVGQSVDLQFVFYSTSADNLGTMWVNGTGRQTTMLVTAADSGSF